MTLPGEIKKDGWNILIEGFEYRKILNEVELNINASKQLTFSNWQNNLIGTLAEDYRPKKDIFFPIFTRNADTAKDFLATCSITVEGKIFISLPTNQEIKVNLERGFVNYSIL